MAAVGPYRQLPVPGRQQGGNNMPLDPLKPQTRSINTRPPPGRSQFKMDHRPGKEHTNAEALSRRDACLGWTPGDQRLQQTAAESTTGLPVISQMRYTWRYTSLWREKEAWGTS